MKILLILVLLLAGCSTGDSAMTEPSKFRTVCLDGVTYYVFRESNGSIGYGYMSVKLNRDSKVVLCGDKS